MTSIDLKSYHLAVIRAIRENAQLLVHGYNESAFHWLAGMQPKDNYDETMKALVSIQARVPSTTPDDVLRPYWRVSRELTAKVSVRQRALASAVGEYLNQRKKLDPAGTFDRNEKLAKLQAIATEIVLVCNELEASIQNARALTTRSDA